MDRPMAVSVNRPVPEVTLPLLTLWLLPLMSTWAADKQIPTLISAAVGERAAPTILPLAVNPLRVSHILLPKQRNTSFIREMLGLPFHPCYAGRA